MSSTAPQQHELKYNLFHPGIFADPFSIYRQMSEEDPVFWCEPMKGWLITRHEDCSAVLRNAATFSSDRMRQLIALQFPQADMRSLSASIEFYTSIMLVKDGAEHTRMRGYINRAFTTRAMESYRPVVEETVQQLLNEAKARGHMDFQHDFAEALPAIVIARLFGIPDEDRHIFKQWTNDVALFFIGAVQNHNDVQRCEDATRQFMDYLEKIIEQRRRQPGEDMLSYVIAGQEGGRLSNREVCTQALLLVAAGHVTTVDMLGASMLALLQHPDQFQRLREEPALQPNAVEELLRYVSPVQIIHRLVTEDVELRGQRLRKGDLVFTVLAAANRDPQLFPEPDRLDLGRSNARQHLAFAGGPHYCVGANLSRIEAEVAFRELQRQLPNLQLAGEPMWRTSGLVFRGLTHLPLKW